MKRLSTEDAEWLRNRVAAMLRLLNVVRQRLDNRGYTPQHRLYQAVTAAYNALHALHITAHYESCERGVGKPSNEE